jgi:hypothetical protein
MKSHRNITKSGIMTHLGEPKRLIETKAAILPTHPSTVQATLLNRHHSRE